MLQNINVMAEPGTLTALVGGSGAGKTVRVAVAVSLWGFWLVASAVWTSAAEAKGTMPGQPCVAPHPCPPQTLMDVVLGRKTVGLIRGDIFVNGHKKEQATWSRVCGCE